jgi:hypothetical protein
MVAAFPALRAFPEAASQMTLDKGQGVKYRQIHGKIRRASLHPNPLFDK